MGGAAYPAETVLRTLDPYLTDERRARIAAVAAARAFGVVPVLEGLVDPGNVNAVLRSAEGLGFGAAHVVGLEGEAAALAAQVEAGDEPTVEDRRAARRSSQGADKWVEVRSWSDPAAYVAWVHGRGGRVAVTALRGDALPIDAWDFSRPTALVVGNEHAGASPAMLDAADAALLLPLDGFVQSYNVSVAAALALYHARADRLGRGGHADLDGPQQRRLRAHYVARAVPLAAALLAEHARREDT
ncbi:TrmH family RNA methyltransferase [Rubrivirga sp. S365]|uniref:TrmH family RNA methyltransferase n=1 Tax=Rubrivirga litoralis TaxID=3075598 RepID=A0ABU3BM81_9BACT|nr:MULTISPECIES: TrmH family RNA methyltransferase [unclassified Rubrivirga]MDT0630402.1 TrmH family RNA methyltransferase [Rubrivirga sp. F394]MDT7855913.1 TrmH family RNA methyltransferase [Rubrivirga sp. S365]